jgi:hypothetical protein
MFKVTGRCRIHFTIDGVFICWSRNKVQPLQPHTAYVMTTGMRWLTASFIGVVLGLFLVIFYHILASVIIAWQHSDAIEWPSYLESYSTVPPETITTVTQGYDKLCSQHMATLQAVNELMAKQRNELSQKLNEFQVIWLR